MLPRQRCEPVADQRRRVRRRGVVERQRRVAAAPCMAEPLDLDQSHDQTAVAPPFARARDVRQHVVASRASKSAGGSVVALPPGTATPFSARYCRTSALRRGGARRRRRPRPGSRAAAPRCRPMLARSSRDLRNVGFRPALHHGERGIRRRGRAACDARMSHDRANESADSARRAPPRARRRPTCRRRRFARDRHASFRATLRIISATIAASPLPATVRASNQFQQRHGFAASALLGHQDQQPVAHRRAP